LQQLWTVLVNFGELLENCVFRPNYYFHHSYATSACFGHPGTILDSFGQFWTTFGKLRFRAKLLFSSLVRNFSMFWTSWTDLGQFLTLEKNLAKLASLALLRQKSITRVIRKDARNT